MYYSSKKLSSIGLLALSLMFFAPNSVNAKAAEVRAQVSQSNTTCSGVVLDKANKPIIGASVLIMGTHTGAVTDLNGKFSIKGVKKGQKLEISCIGYKTEHVVFNGEPLKLVLKDDKELLNEVVVVGFGTQKKVNVTGAVATVNAKTLKNRPVQNVTQVLQGQIPGLNISTTQGGGELDAGNSINIRGIGTIGSGSSASPLVIVDGIPSNLNSVNPNDIASISVLKDAASSSIYGSRAAFGVILIKTKSGKAGATKVTYSGNIRVAQPTNLPEVVSNTKFAEYFNLAQANANGGFVFNQDILDMMKKYNAGEFKDPKTPEYWGATLGTDGFLGNYNSAFANNNWFDVIYSKLASSYENNINISGGKAGVNYNVSVNYLHHRGLLKVGKDLQRRFFVNANLQVPIGKWGTLTYLGKWKRDNFTMPTHLYRFGGLFLHNIARRWPTNPYREPGGYFQHGNEINELLLGGVSTNTSNSLTNQLVFDFHPIKDWHLRVDMADVQYYTNTHKPELQFFEHKFDGTPSPAGGDSRGSGFNGEDQISTTSGDHYTFNAISEYHHQFGPSFVKFMAGMSAELYDDRSLWGSGKNYISQQVPQLAKTVDEIKAANGASQLALLGYFARLNYNYKEKYLLELNIRTDASSRFLKNRRWGVFPSISMGWNLAKEDFMNFADSWMNTFKLRASWGSLGNNDINSRYPFYQSIGTGYQNSGWLINYKKQNTARVPGLVTQSLTWETVTSWDLGLDYAFLRDRLTGSFDLFARQTMNMVGPAPVVPGILGTAAPQINNADLITKGWEFEIQWKDNIGAFNYSARFNLSDNVTTVTRYENPTGSIWNWYAGKRVGEIWGYTTEGIAQTPEQMAKHLKTATPSWGNKWAAGDVMYKNLTYETKKDTIVNGGSGTLQDHGDLRIIGNSSPRFSFGLNLTASYKGFDASLFMQGIGKRDYVFGAGDPYFWGAVGNRWQSTVFKQHLNYWTPEHKNAYYPRPIFEGGKNRQVQTRYMQNAAYARIKNLQLGYTLPTKISKQIGMSLLRFYISIDNVATITKLTSIFDPEAIAGRWGSGKIYPLQRVYSLGVNLTF